MVASQIHLAKLSKVVLRVKHGAMRSYVHRDHIRREQFLQPSLRCHKFSISQVVNWGSDKASGEAWKI
jgi:hypothetical protein